MSFVPVPFPALLTRLERESRTGRLFGDTADGWWRPGVRDLSASLFGHRAGNPFGPAAGPHTQLAPNLVRAWLAGGRFLELRTVAARAATGVPRPSVRVADAGFNVESSQELPPHVALGEYAKAAALIAILDHEDGFGMLHAHRGRDTIIDASVGYDLAGIRSGPMRAYLAGLKDPSALYAGLRGELSGVLGRFRSMFPEGPLASTVTLSTFHGCPPKEIEAIVRHLLEEWGFSVVLKLNPTLLGRRAVTQIVHERLGFTHLSLVPEAFAHDLKLAPALAMIRRLSAAARDAGTGFGVKLTNTLVVRNDPKLFPTQRDGTMHLSGGPLHVLAMELLVRLGRELGPDVPISFSAGVTEANAAETASCGLLPVTSCTDLLRPPGYPRLARQVRKLEKEMQGRGVSSLPAFVFAHGHGRAAVEETFAALGINADPVLAKTPEELVTLVRIAAAEARHDAERVLERTVRAAGLRNAADLLPRIEADARYRYLGHASPRVRKGSLAVWDCRNCDLCLEVCPNGALFPFTVPGEKGYQIALVDDLCDACGHCGLFCPDGGEPHAVKTRLFLSRAAFDAAPRADGYLLEERRLIARRGGRLVDECDPAVAEATAKVRRGVLDAHAGVFALPHPAEEVAP